MLRNRKGFTTAELTQPRRGAIGPGSLFLCNGSLDFFRVPEIDAVSEADIIGTGRIEALRDPVITEVALPGNPDFFIKHDCIVGARPVCNNCRTRYTSAPPEEPPSSMAISPGGARALRHSQDGGVTRDNE